MELNILTNGTGQKARNSYELTNEHFWRMYLRLLYTINQHITVREEDILSYILSTDPTVNHFNVPHSKNLKEELSLAASELTRLKTSLKAKRLLDDNYIPVKPLLVLQNYIKKNKQVTFVFPLKII